MIAAGTASSVLPTPFLDVSPEVTETVAASGAVVALESTIICIVKK